MVSIGELSLNVVKTNKPKTLTGLGQKATGWAKEFESLLSWTTNTLGGKREPAPILSFTRNVVSPSCSPWVGGS